MVMEGIKPVGETLKKNYKKKLGKTHQKREKIVKLH